MDTHTASSAKASKAPTYTTIQAHPANAHESVSYFEDFKSLILGEYSVELLECQIGDIKVQSTGHLLIGGVDYTFAPHGLRAFCKVIHKGLYAFVQTVPAFAIQTILDDLKSLDDRTLKLYVKSGTTTILNVLPSQKMSVEYMPDLLEVLSTIESDSAYVFHNGQLSDCGFQLNYVFSKNGVPSEIGVGEHRYLIGKSVVGDVYGIRGKVELQTWVRHVVDGAGVNLGKYQMRKHGLNNDHEVSSFKLTSKKALEGNEKKGIQPFKDAFKESFVGYSNSREVDLQTMVSVAAATDISIWKFFELRGKLTKLSDDIAFADSLIGVTPELLEKLKVDKKDILSTVPLANVDKTLKATKVPGLNAKVIFDSIINYASGTELSEYWAFSAIAMNVVVDTFNHSFEA